jgi:hypothetical protein
MEDDAFQLLSPARSCRTAGLRASQKARDIEERASLIPETNLPLRTFQPTPASAFGRVIQDASSLPFLHGSSAVPPYYCLGGAVLNRSPA